MRATLKVQQKESFCCRTLQSDGRQIRDKQKISSIHQAENALFRLSYIHLGPWKNLGEGRGDSGRCWSTGGMLSSAADWLPVDHRV